VNKNKVVHSRLLPYANAVVQDNQTGFQSGKSTTDQPEADWYQKVSAAFNTKNMDANEKGRKPILRL
jgi:hypothetical protein